MSHDLENKFLQLIIADLHVLTSLCGAKLIGLCLCSSFHRSQSSSSFSATEQVQKETNVRELEATLKKRQCCYLNVTLTTIQEQTNLLSRGANTPQVYSHCND